ncbi:MULTISPECIES: TetR/AcrR family transcriptional regulator [unclassified Variovorax]|uniref:TetR/AcrR family transcriptional regulator n=1 Tax=unclassified Variovorax TaxID=663243 RepID=UPI001BD2F984|nr:MULTISPECIES: TetR/AcrR family transcriptional regulator [unclassified Variovorax]
METKKSLAPQRGSARERLLAAADELFYEGGIHTVGIERVIERAGVAKASLYDCFGSKEELIRAYLQSRQEARRLRITARLATYTTPRDRLLGVFDAMEDLMASGNFRGCAFNRAASESKAGGVIQSTCDDARGWMRELFTGLARDAGAADPEALARQLMLLYDGASVSGQLEFGSGAAATARAIAAHMLDTAIPAKARKKVAA